MVVIVGWGGGRAQDFGEVAPLTCPSCHNLVFLHHIRSNKSVSLYFIPLVQYDSDEYLACPICRAGLQVHPGQRGAVLRMRAATSAFRTRTMSLDAYQPLVDPFWRELGVDPSGHPVPHSASGVPTPESAQVDAPTASLAARLEGLGKLHAAGTLTAEEFAAAKRRLLES